jgi:hypothetical protein
VHKAVAYFASIAVGASGLAFAAPPVNASTCRTPSATISGGLNAGDLISWTVDVGDPNCSARISITTDYDDVFSDTRKGNSSGTLPAQCGTLYAIRATGDGGGSGTASFKTPVWPVLAPGAPSPISVDYTSARIGWPWQGREGGCGQDYPRQDLIVDGVGTFNPGFNDAEKATVTGLRAGTTYTMRVVIGDKTSPDSTFTTPAYQRPSVVGNLTGSSPTKTSAALNWDAPTEDGGQSVSGYQVSWSGGSTTVSDSQAVVTGLKAKTPYVFTVAAINSVGTGPGVTVGVTTGDDTPAPRPTPTPTPDSSTRDSAAPITVDGGNGANQDGSHDADNDPTTVRQYLTSTAKWPEFVVRSGKQHLLIPVKDLRTNAGALATVKITKKSPSVRTDRIVTKAGKKYLQVTLKPKRNSGTLVVTISAPAIPGFEVLQSSKAYRVLR